MPNSPEYGPVHNFEAPSGSGPEIKPADKKTGKQLGRRMFLKAALGGGLALGSAQEAKGGDILIPEGGTVSRLQRPDGRVEFKHSDPETTHILSLVSGRESLTEKDRYAILRAGFVENALQDDKKQYLEKSVEQWGNATDEEIFMAGLKKNFPMLEDKLLIDIIKNNRSLFLNSQLPWKQQKPDDQLYQGLWDAEKRVNNPKINWGTKPTSGKGLRSGIASIFGKGLVELDGALYAPGTNTLFITRLNFTSWEWLGMESLGEMKKYANPQEQKRVQELAGPLRERLKAQVELQSRAEEELNKILAEAQKKFSYISSDVEFTLRSEAFEKHFGKSQDHTIGEIKQYLDTVAATPEFKAKRQALLDQRKKAAETELLNLLRSFPVQ